MENYQLSKRQNQHKEMNKKKIVSHAPMNNNETQRKITELHNQTRRQG